MVDLHPAGALSSAAVATDGVLQGGWSDWQLQFVETHATIWNGTAQSFVDLRPSGGYSRVVGMAPGVQVGEFVLGGSNRAALWRGTPQSFLDLNPPGTGMSGCQGQLQ